MAQSKKTGRTDLNVDIQIGRRSGATVENRPRVHYRVDGVVPWNDRDRQESAVRQLADSRTIYGDVVEGIPPSVACFPIDNELATVRLDRRMLIRRVISTEPRL